MTRKIFGLLTCLISLSILVTNAQTSTPLSITERSELPSSIQFDRVLSGSELQGAINKKFDRDNDLGFAPLRIPLRDKLGLKHQRFDQTYKGRVVFGSSVSAHGTESGFTSLNGALLKQVSAEAASEPMISGAQALELAKEFVGADLYMWESPEMELFIKREQGDHLSTFYPDADLIYYPTGLPNMDGDLRLAYSLDVYARKPGSRSTVIVDAVDGQILANYDKLHNIDEPGTGETAYRGNQDIITFRASTTSVYELQDQSRGGGILTYDCMDTDNYAGAQIPNRVNNNWDYGDLTANAILDAHWGTEMTYDYFMLEHGWNSYNNLGSPLRSYVHFSLIDYGFSSNVNAFWDGSRMTYGDGNGTTYNPLTCLDIVGHEITHGVTSNSANLVYSYESGALNESFSDIFGMCISYYAAPSQFTWKIGVDVSTSGNSYFRNMSNPNLRGDPDTYLGTYWHTSSGDHGGVHTNSGVQNFWFYLLVEGGAGVNDIGNQYEVTPIGREDAAAIAFRTLTVYLNSSSQYADARTFSIQAATDLFGECSDQVVQTTNAWYAVGVGDVYNGGVTAGMQVGGNYTCTVPGAVQFNNTSVNATTYLWDFGDGTTSTDVSPIHVYLTAGNYSTSLTAYGSSNCNSVDTAESSIPIAIGTLGTLVAPVCEPEAQSPSENGGILEFDIEAIQNFSTGSEYGFQDFSCNFLTSLTEGAYYPFTAVLDNPGYLKIWIDTDDNGDFTQNELVYESGVSLIDHTAQILVPAPTNYGSSLRLRVVSDTDFISDACTVSPLGQAEDYAVTIEENFNPPIADFTSNVISALVGEPISLEDISANIPTSWQWLLPWSDLSTSTDQHPNVSYANTGTYNVELIASNSYGSDTILIEDYITIVNSYNLCEVEYTAAISGTFYDPGGQSGNYGNSDYCELLISPECAAEITLTFDQFNTLTGDLLYIHDGDNSSAPLVGTYSGNTIPASLTLGGSVFVVWESSFSSVSSGFAVNWTATTGSSDPITTVASASNLNPTYGAEVQFTDLSVEIPNEWLWDLGDGNTSTEQNVAHTYSTPGVKTVILTATNCVSTDSDTLYVDVQDVPSATVEPTQLNLLFPNCEDSIVAGFWLHNSGAGDLVFSSSDLVLMDDFENSEPNPGVWNTTTGLLNDGCGSNSGSQALHFEGTSERHAITRPLNLGPDGEIGFHLKYGNSSYPCDEIDGSEYARVIYSLDGGVNYSYLINYTIENNFNDFTQVNIAVPEDAINVPTMFQIYQIGADGTGDNWAIDDFYASGVQVFTDLIPGSGTVPANDSLFVNFTLYRNSFIEGTYQAELEFHTNDTANPVMLLPIEYTIEGDGTMELSDTCASFAEIQEFTTTTDTIFLYNTGCNDIVVDSVIVHHPYFQSALSSDTIIPLDSVSMIVTFAPLNFGAVDSTLTIYYDGTSDTTLCVSGLSTGSAIVSADPNMLDIDFVNCSDSVVGTFWLHNTGNDILNWSALSVITDPFEGNDENPDFWEYTTGYNSTVCGVISGTRAHAFASAADRIIRTHPFNISNGSTFSFSLIYGSGGSCDNVETGEHVVLEYSLDGASWNLISTYSPIATYQEWTSITEVLPSAAYGSQTQLRLRQVSDSGSGTDEWAIENASLSIYLNSQVVAPNIGSLAIQDSVELTFTYLRDTLTEGTYQDTIWIASNDPVNPAYGIPLEISVSGEGELVMEPGCFDFDEIPENSVIADSLMLVNDGCAPLLLTDFLTTETEFVVSPDTIILAPYDTVYLAMQYQPQLFGSDSASLVFYADGILITQCIRGSATAEPFITITPDTLFVSAVNCADTIIGSFSIANSGNDVLNWSASGLTNLTDDFENAQVNPDLWEIAGGFNSGIYCGTYEGNNAHYFAGTNRIIQTLPFSMSSGTTVSFYLKYGSGGNCDNVESNEYVVLEYSLDGSVWTIFASYTSISAFHNWGYVSETLPAAATSNATRIRLRQPAYSGSSTDMWAIDLFELGAGSSEGLFVSPDQGIVLEGDSIEVSFGIGSSNFVEGTYDLEIAVVSDDPLNPYITIPVVVNYEGDPELTFVDTGCFDYGALFVGADSIADIQFVNSGCAPLYLTAVGSEPSFSVLAYTDTVLPDSIGHLQVSFEPSAITTYQDTLHLSTNIGEVLLCVVGEGVAAPEVVVNPTNISIVYDGCVDVQTVSVYVGNDGGAQLDVEFSESLTNPDLSIDTILANWLMGYPSVTSLIPSPYFFSEGETGYRISDGGNDMFDNGNRIRTNTGNTIYYSQNTVLADTDFGINGKYFTSKVNGMFITVADMDDVQSFEIFGGLGHDGQASVDVSTITHVTGGTSFTGYIKRVFNSVNPSVNHLIITKTNAGIIQDYDPAAQNDDHSLMNLQNTPRLFSIMFATASGGYVSDQQMQAIMNTFLEVVLEHDGYLTSVDPASMVFPPGADTLVTLTFENNHGQAGSYQSSLYVSTNDPANPLVEITVNIEVPPIPCAAFDFEYVDGCMGEVQFLNFTTNSNGLFLWDFGDGTTTTLEAPSHLYTEAGIFTVTLTAGTGTMTSTYEFEVEVQPLDASFINTDPNTSSGYVEFASTTANAAEWLWTFGDGGISTEEYPTHVYANYGTYVVTLFASDTNGCPGIATDTVFYGIDGIGENPLYEVSVFPNPTSGVLHITGLQKIDQVEIKLVDISGKIISHIGRLNEHSSTITLEGLSAGVYILVLATEDYNRHVRIVKQ